MVLIHCVSVSSCNVYKAVPPPLQLLNGVQCSGNEVKANSNSAVNSTPSAMNSAAIPPIPSATHPGISTALPHSMGLSCGHFQPNLVCNPQPSLVVGTSYSGYGGIYPQATPLQQVALALRKSSSFVNSAVASPTTAANTAENYIPSLSSAKEKRLPQKRKFQELPVASEGRANPHQVPVLTLLAMEGIAFYGHLRQQKKNENHLDWKNSLF